MTLLAVALKNVRHRALSYAAFFLSSSFAGQRHRPPLRSGDSGAPAAAGLAPLLLFVAGNPALLRPLPADHHLGLCCGTSQHRPAAARHDPAGSARPKEPSRPSRLLAFLSAGCLAFFYLSLFLADDRFLSRFQVYIIAAGLVGTYLFVLSQLSYRLRDNVGTLFLVTATTTLSIGVAAFSFSIHFTALYGWNPNTRIGQGADLRLMVLTFLSLIFFLGAGNILYFKLFTDLEEDRKQFQALHKLGLDPDEIGRIAGAQTALLFALPALLAALTAALFQSRNTGFFSPKIWFVTLAVFLVYAILQTLYFLVTHRTYTRVLQKGM